MFSRVEKNLLSAGVAIYMTRMVGLFMLLPVLAVFASHLQGASPLTVGLALGAYGLTQSLMQIPMGWLSDRYGRRRIILVGLGIFALGTLVAVFANTMPVLILGRALQGLGAVSGALLALIGDSSRDENRSKIMAVIGISIGVSFGIAMVVGPVIAHWGGLPAIFWTIFALCLFSMVLGYRLLPQSKQHAAPQARGHWSLVFKNSDLLRLDVSILLLHTIQMSMWVAVPLLLVNQFELPTNRHWLVYLIAVFGSFIVMAPFMQIMERKRQHRAMILSGIGAVLLAQLLLNQSASLWIFVAALFVFFWGFNLLEATLPSMTSRVVDSSRRGFAMGTFSSFQFGGAFLGGVLGGSIGGAFGLQAIFLACAGLAFVWLFLAWSLRELDHIRTLVLDLNGNQVDLDELKALPGVLGIQSFPVQAEALVRLDMDKIDRPHLENLIGRPI